MAFCIQLSSSLTKQRHFRNSLLLWNFILRLPSIIYPFDLVVCHINDRALNQPSTASLQCRFCPTILIFHQLRAFGSPGCCLCSHLKSGKQARTIEEGTLERNRTPFFLKLSTYHEDSGSLRFIIPPKCTAETSSLRTKFSSVALLRGKYGIHLSCSFISLLSNSATLYFVL